MEIRGQEFMESYFYRNLKKMTSLRDHKRLLKSVNRTKSQEKPPTYNSIKIVFSKNFSSLL